MYMYLRSYGYKNICKLPAVLQFFKLFEVNVWNYKALGNKLSTIICAIGIFDLVYIVSYRIIHVYNTNLPIIY